MTNQEAFNIAYLGVVKQGCKSMRPRPRAADGEMCAYRGNNGAKCAAGHLIPDDLYKVEFEGMGTHCTEVRQAIPDGIDSSLLSDLQSAHDGASTSGFVDSFKQRAAQVAADWGLTVPEAP